ncbi:MULTISPECIES: TspO/MBR family protein [unclassified Sphingomonas]|uniref:TspO/MBR family protein n=1 Tax=unclassified Sphingomonas TaxID=196159 RepID=UPI000BD3B28F|nr:MAG: TspO protein [Sphingomonas sp. 12-62-6]OYX40276.1 MAG: TspO protein [Sphingomonas sp. 32-62-10]OYY65457.1 MAG: TspO protein [Sphingomonas sp. 28-62-11]
MTRASLFPILIAALATAIVAIMGSTITVTGPWYDGLVQPRWAPPEAAYGVAWTAIYAINVIAVVTAWRAMETRRESEGLVALWAMNGFLNILWSLLFFRLQRPDWALIEVVFLWLSVGSLIVYSWRRSMMAAILVVPYILWVTFAGYLNLAIVRLNGPFS